VKIRFVTPWYGEFAGGAEYGVRQLSEQLLKYGVDVGVLTTCCKSPFDNWWSDYYKPGEYDLNGVPVLRFRVNKGGQIAYHEAVYKMIHGIPITKDEELKFMRGGINSHALIAFIKKNPLYTYVFFPYLYGPTYWGVNALPSRAVVIPALHDEPIAKWEIVKDIFLHARMLIFLTPEEQQLAQRLYGNGLSESAVLGLGTETQVLSSPERFREKYGIRDPYLIFVGRKDSGKNITLLMKYFDEYVGRYKNNLKLVFVGGGNLSVCSPDNPKIIDLGLISHQDKCDAIAASLALCNLSRYESFSYVMMEAWLTGRPVIVNKECNVTVGHCIRSQGGFFISDVEEFCDRVRYLELRPWIGAEMGMRGREYVLNNYSWERVLPSYIKVLEKVS
jgi:glycosyltransferase involved in cell wall biosynthesis